MTHRIAGRTRKPWLALAGLIGVAAFFRLYELGLSAFRGDEILLWDLALRKVPPMLLLTQWFEVSGAAGQMPMPAYLIQQFLALAGWPITPWFVRFPCAFFGILTVPVVFFGGRRWFGTSFGLLLAALLSVNSFHIATSREAYFYSTLILGYFLYFWCSATIIERLLTGQALTRGDLAVLGAALFFTAYSQITGLLLCLAAAVLFFGVLALRQRKTPVFKRNLISLTMVHAVLLTPVALASWGLRPLLSQIMANRDLAAQASAISGRSLLGGVIEAMEQFSWGWTGFRIALLLLVVGGAIFAFIRNREIRGLWLLYFILAEIVLFSASRKAAGASCEARYMSASFPFFLAVLAYGLLESPKAMAGVWLKPNFLKDLTSVFCVCGLGACLYPAYLQTQLTGKPAPYYDIVRWCDSNLPRNTPVLVDRWFEPWNELKAHPSTNVIFTFTIPNEPVDVYLKYHWRETAEDFLRKYPDAAYLEIAKSYWKVPGIGPWEWPRQYFSRHVVFANEAGLKLRKLGLANRGDFYNANSNWLVCEMFYNTRDDVLAKARQAGAKSLVLYGPDWGYTKLWPQIQDFRDWRVLSGQASLDVYNLTDAPRSLKLKLRGVAVNGSKQVEASTGAKHTFSKGQLEVWEPGVVSLAPGLTSINLTDALWQAGQAPLLVDGVEVEEFPSPSSATDNNTQ
jgi:hypothetical protein